MQSCDIFLGRFQPFHNGHLAATEKMNHKKIIAVVHGKKSKHSENPIPVEKQVNMIKKVVEKDTLVLQVDNGYIPDLIEMIRDTYHLDPKTVVCGKDRIDTYLAQIERANRTLEDKYVIEFKEAERITSGSEVREAIRSGDKKAFKANVPKQLWDEFTNLTEYMRGK